MDKVEMFKSKLKNAVSAYQAIYFRNKAKWTSIKGFLRPVIADLIVDQA